MISILDIGSSAGILLNMFRSNGYKTYGIEPNESFALYSKKFGHNIEIGTYHEGLFNNEKFDIITMSHVLEHCPDPIWIISSLKIKLKENGLMAMEVPNVMKPNGPLNGFFQLPHLYTFSKDTFLKVICLAGFHDILAVDDNYPHLRLLVKNSEVKNCHKYLDNTADYMRVVKSLRKYQRQYWICKGPVQILKNSIKAITKKIVGKNIFNQLVSYRYRREIN